MRTGNQWSNSTTLGYGDDEPGSALVICLTTVNPGDKVLTSVQNMVNATVYTGAVAVATAGSTAQAKKGGC